MQGIQCHEHVLSYISFECNLTENESKGDRFQVWLCSAVLVQGSSCLSKCAQQEKLKGSKPKAPKICSRRSKKVMWLSRETEFSGKFKFMFCCSHIPEYFLRNLQDFDGNLKYTWVTRKELRQLNIQQIKVFFPSNSGNLCPAAGYEVQEIWKNVWNTSSWNKSMWI